MSFFSDKTREECWEYLRRHLALIPLAANASDAERFLLWKEEQARISTVGCYMAHIKAFGTYLDQKPWREATYDDVFLHIKGATGNQGRRALRDGGKPVRVLGPYTKYQRMVMLREFYKWLLEIDEVPPMFRRLPFAKPSMEDQLEGRNDRLSQDEIVAMLAATTSKRDRAIVMLLADSGLRAGEAAALNVSDVHFDDYGCKVWHEKKQRTQGRTPGLKTGRRKVPTRLTIATPYLREWIGEHPWRTQGAPPLLPNLSNRNAGTRMTAGGIWTVISTLSRKAKIRHVHPHMFRHTAASIRAGDGWNEEMMRLHFGWSKGSSMPSFYSHNEADYDAFALRKAGLPVPAPEAQTWQRPCPSCDALNEPDKVFCVACGVSMGAE